MILHWNLSRFYLWKEICWLRNVAKSLLETQSRRWSHPYPPKEVWQLTDDHPCHHMPRGSRKCRGWDRLDGMEQILRTRARELKKWCHLVVRVVRLRNWTVGLDTQNCRNSKEWPLPQHLYISYISILHPNEISSAAYIIQMYSIWKYEIGWNNMQLWTMWATIQLDLSVVSFVGLGRWSNQRRWDASNTCVGCRSHEGRMGKVQWLNDRQW